jgi:hypothetical protein
VLGAGQALGLTEMLPADDRRLYGESYLADTLAVRLGGRAGERLIAVKPPPALPATSLPPPHWPPRWSASSGSATSSDRSATPASPTGTPPSASAATPSTPSGSGAGHLSAAQVSSITPQGLAHLAVPLRQVIASAFAQALPPSYAYLIPLLAVAFLFALLLKEIPLHTRAERAAWADGRPRG